MYAGIDCGSLPSLVNGQIISSSITYVSTANYVCNSGYNLVGSSIRTCQASGQWNGTASECVSVPSTPPTTTMPPQSSTAPSPTGV